MIKNLKAVLSSDQKKDIQKYKKSVRKSTPFKMWKHQVDLYVNKFPTIIQVMQININEDPTYPILNKMQKINQRWIYFYVTLLYSITFGIPIMMISVFIFSPKCAPEWKCPDSFNINCQGCIELCPYYRYGITNKLVGFLLFLVLVYQQKVEGENEIMSNYTIMRSVVFNANVEVYNELYVSVMQLFLYFSTYILFVSNSDYVELLLNCLALTFYSTVDDILGAYFCGRILLPFKMRELLVTALNEGKYYEEKGEWKEAFHHYLSLYKYSNLPCQIYHETPRKNMLYIDPNQIMERIKYCDMKLKGLDVELGPLENVKITDESDLNLNDYKHMLRYSGFREENEAKKIMQQDKFYTFNIVLNYIDKVAIVAFCFLIPICI